MISYSFDPDYTVEGRHYAHPLISWPTIVAGAIAAIAIGFLLNVLGLALGAGVFNPYQTAAHTETMTVMGGLYMIFAQFVALQAGAYIASRAARYPDHFGGALTGFMVWALAVVAALLLGAFAGALLSSGDVASGNVAQTVDSVSDAVTATGASNGDLAATNGAAHVTSAIAWWVVGAIGLGLAGSVAGGWLGAHHPKWETRPRLDDRAAYKLGPEI
jgi:hypothetical protein